MQIKPTKPTRANFGFDFKLQELGITAELAHK
jgi:hypothetical protein